MRDSLKTLLRNRNFGVPALTVARAIGAKSIERRLANLCGYVPNIVTDRLPQGKKISMNSMDGRDGVAWTIYHRSWRNFECPLPEAILAVVEDGAIFLDVGANSGFYSLLIDKLRPSSRAIAFEPLPEAIAALTRNIALNNATQIELRQTAVGEVCGRSTLFLPDSGHGLLETSASLNANFKEVHEGCIEVDVVTLDRTAREIASIGAIKIDVEGADEMVLRGGRDLLSAQRPPIFVEILDDEAGMRIRDVVHPLGYKAFTLKPPKVVLPNPNYCGSALQRNQLLCHEDELDRVMKKLAEAEFTIESRT